MTDMDFRGASADAVVSLTDELKATVTGSSAAAAADALFAVSGSFRTEAALRRFATDSAIPAEAKTGLVEQVFGRAVDAATLRLLSSAVSQRWTHGGDLPNAIERLSEIAAVLSAGDQATQVGNELFTLGRAVSDNPQLRDALSDPGRSTQDKAALLDRLLEGKALPATVTLAKQSLAGSYGTVEAALDAYRTLAAEVQGEGVATVTVAAPLTDDQAARLTAALGRIYGRKIHANVVTDPAVLGGVKVEIGDDVIDGSIANRLDLATRQMAG